MKRIPRLMIVSLIPILLLGVITCDKKIKNTIAGSSATTPTISILAAPSNLTIYRRSTTYIPEGLGGPYTEDLLGLQWVDHSENETSFEIQRQMGTGNWKVYSTTSANNPVSVASQTSLMGLCRYRVLARNAGGYSNPSNTISWIVE